MQVILLWLTKNVFKDYNRNEKFPEIHGNGPNEMFEVWQMYIHYNQKGPTKGIVLVWFTYNSI